MLKIPRRNEIAIKTAQILMCFRPLASQYKKRPIVKKENDDAEKSIKKPITTFEGSRHSANTNVGTHKHRYTKNNKALNLFIDTEYHERLVRQWSVVFVSRYV